MNKLKKFISVLLSATILMSMTTLAVSANETSTEPPSAELITDDYSITANNSMGSLITDAIENYDTGTGTQYESCITDIEVVNSVATVEYSAIQDCTILVALYDENTDKMLASGKASALAEEKTVNVTIETEQMPTAYVLKAFMLDDNYKPLADAHTDVMHTTAMLELLAMSTNDFEEEEILNLDENENTNFAVYADGVIKFSMNDTKNILRSYDETNGVYVFENASNKLINLTKGDIAVCDEDPSNIVIIKVKSTESNGNTITITEDETSLDEVFEYVKIESTENKENIPNKKTTSAYASKAAQNADGTSNESAIESKIWYKDFDEKLDDDLTCKGEISLNITLTTELYVSKKEFSFDFDVSFNFKGSIEFECNFMDYPITICEFPEVQFMPISCVTIKLGPELKVTITGKFKVEFIVEGKVGFSANNNGITPIHEISITPTAELEGEVFFGVDLGPEIEIISDKIAEVELGATLGLKAVGTQTITDDFTFGSTTEKKHSCKRCFELTLGPCITLDASAKILGRKFTTDPLAELWFNKVDFYHSYDYDHSGHGECPFNDYLMNIKVKDTSDLPVGYANVTYTSHLGDEKSLGITDFEGELTGYVPGYQLNKDGKPTALRYSFTAEKNGESYSSYQYYDPDLFNKVTIIFGENTDSLIINVYDENSKALKDAYVHVNYDSNTKHTEGFTDELGLCILKVEKYDIYNIYIEHGSKSESRTISLSKDGPRHDFYLKDEETTVPINPSDPSNPTEPIDPSNPTGPVDPSNPSNPTEPIDPSNPSNPTDPIDPSNPNNPIEPTEPPTKPISIIASGYCGQLAKWTLDENNCLTISGSGNMDDYNTYYDYNTFIKKINTPWYKYRDSITKVIVESGITTIGRYAFKDCCNLTEVILANSVVSINDNAFLSCPVKSITLPDSLKKIGAFAFGGCTFKNITLPDSLEEISNGAFSYCENLESIFIPDKVKNLGTYNEFGEDSFGGCFKGCENLKEIYLPEGLKGIFRDTFSECSNLSSIVFPSSLEYIGDGAFYACHSLNNIKIPENVTTIGNDTFKGCSQLSEITLPSTLKTIGKYAFEGCRFTEVILPDSLEIIDEHAFLNCSHLNYIHIPSTVTKIGYRAFHSYSHTNRNFEVWFYCDSTGLDPSIFTYEDCITAYYPAGNPTWTADKLTNYGSKEITWISHNNLSSACSSPVSCASPAPCSANEVGSISYDNLCKNTNYVIAVVKSTEAEDILAANNLLYFNQYKSDENGCLSVNNILVDETEGFEILIFGKTKGDVNCDNNFDVNDITYIQMFIAHYKKEDGSEMIDIDDYETFVSADFDDNGTINISDATHMQLTLAGIV